MNQASWRADARRWRADAGSAPRRPRAYGRAARVHARSADGDQRPSAMVPLTLACNRAQTHSELTDVPHDPKSRYFLGTLRYASPEFLLRREQDSPDGWRAVTTYQIGTVLYEMIHVSRVFGLARQADFR